VEPPREPGCGGSSPGSGKSTLLKDLTGVARLSSGRVLVGDRDLTGLPPEEVAGREASADRRVIGVFPGSARC
jgi:branched-chain amino acid transport system ATP-binding protein